MSKQPERELLSTVLILCLLREIKITWPHMVFGEYSWLYSFEKVKGFINSIE